MGSIIILKNSFFLVLFLLKPLLSFASANAENLSKSDVRGSVGPLGPELLRDLKEVLEVRGLVVVHNVDQVVNAVRLKPNITSHFLKSKYIILGRIQNV